MQPGRACLAAAGSPPSVMSGCNGGTEMQKSVHVSSIALVNDLLSDPCAYGQRKKVLMHAYPPHTHTPLSNESAILRILGMNKRNKITLKMLHLTVRGVEAAELLPTAPSSHLRQLQELLDQEQALHRGPGPLYLHPSITYSLSTSLCLFFSCGFLTQESGLCTCSCSPEEEL